MPLFPPRREPQVNYDWIDLVSATGYILYDGFNALDSSGDNYSLIESSHASNILGTWYTSTINNPGITKVTGNSGQSTDIDFDTSIFQLPRTIEGDAFVRVSTGGGGVDVAAVVITAKLRKFSGSESEIVSVTTDTFIMSANIDYSRTLKLVVPRTHFKARDHLRLTIQISTGDNDVYFIAHNPRDTVLTIMEANNTRLVLAVPFKLDFL